MISIASHVCEASGWLQIESCPAQFGLDQYQICLKNHHAVQQGTTAAAGRRMSPNCLHLQAIRALRACGEAEQGSTSSRSSSR